MVLTRYTTNNPSNNQVRTLKPSQAKTRTLKEIESQPSQHYLSQPTHHPHSLTAAQDTSSSHWLADLRYLDPTQMTSAAAALAAAVPGPQRHSAGELLALPARHEFLRESVGGPLRKWQEGGSSGDLRWRQQVVLVPLGRVAVALASEALVALVGTELVRLGLVPAEVACWRGVQALVEVVACWRGALGLAWSVVVAVAAVGRPGVELRLCSWLVAVAVAVEGTPDAVVGTSGVELRLCFWKRWR